MRNRSTRPSPSAGGDGDRVDVTDPLDGVVGDHADAVHITVASLRTIGRLLRDGERLGDADARQPVVVLDAGRAAVRPARRAGGPALPACSTSRELAGDVGVLLLDGHYGLHPGCLVAQGYADRRRRDGTFVAEGQVTAGAPGVLVSQRRRRRVDLRTGRPYRACSRWSRGVAARGYAGGTAGVRRRRSRWMPTASSPSVRRCRRRRAAPPPVSAPGAATGVVLANARRGAIGRLLEASASVLRWQRPSIIGLAQPLLRRLRRRRPR
ncbi:MAG: hypothetical protein QM760_21680 [Nibricoccus sp.]